LLNLFVRDYKHIIPKNVYLILGNQSGGSLDSTRFRLASQNDILGKVISEKEEGPVRKNY